MTDYKKIGELNYSGPKVEIEWKIPDFFLYSQEDCAFASPDFHALNSTWYLLVFPNGHKQTKSTGFVSLYLRNHDSKAKELYCEFGIKTGHNSVQDKHGFTWSEECSGKSKFIERSELQRKKSTLVPSSGVILTCLVKENGDVPDVEASKYYFHSLYVLDF